MAGFYTPATQDTLGQIPLYEGIGVVQRVKTPQPFESNLGDLKLTSQLTQLAAVTFIADQTRVRVTSQKQLNKSPPSTDYPR
jgi:hypothetical protein